MSRKKIENVRSYILDFLSEICLLQTAVHYNPVRNSFVLQKLVYFRLKLCKPFNILLSIAQISSYL